METITTTTNSNASTTETTNSSNWKLWVGGLALGGMLLANLGLYSRSSRIETEMNKLRSTTSTELSNLKDAHTTSTQSAQKTIEELTAQLEETQANAKKAIATAAGATAQARANSDKASKRAEELVTTLAEQSKTQHAAAIEAIGAVKQAAEANSVKVGEVANEVGTVKSEVAATKSTLDSTIAELKSVRGDLGVQSGLIATNAKELAALRELGERNYYEFAITKQNGIVKVGTVALTLKKADVKKSKFNLELVADDKRVEKKDKTINEPVQFYVANSRLPYEIVVNQVQKDRIVGYLATPKVLSARR